MSETENKNKAWYEAWFGREYLEVYAHRNDAEAAQDIDNIERLLNLHTDSPILDLACGSGRHSIELTRRGYTVTGIDLSAELLEVAKKQAEKEGFNIAFIRADMRTPPFTESFQTVINMFTSFGYFENEEENRKIMRAIHTVLKPGGQFIIDYINRDLVLANLVPHDSKRVGNKTVEQNRHYNRETRRLEKTITIREGEKERTFLESVRLYNSDEMVAMAETSGLTIASIYGALDGRAAGPEEPRVILTGNKPNL